MALKVYDVSVEMIRELRPVVEQVARRDRSLADQMRRAASSVVLNTAEATDSVGGNQRSRFRTALGSASETRAALDVAMAWGYVSVAQGEPLKERVGRIRRMLWPLAR